MRQKRQTQILKIISASDIKTQEQMTEELRKLGFDTTQATVSRDIKELGLIKISSADGGYKYAAKQHNANVEPKHIDIFSGAVISVTYALHTIVIRTYPGMAQAVCASGDALFGDKMLGSIAGEDTILIITESEKAAEEMCEELKKIFRN